jgi:hypothetical protein
MRLGEFFSSFGRDDPFKAPFSAIVVEINLNIL